MVLAQAQEVDPGARRLRDDPQRVHPQVLHLTEVEEDVGIQLMERAAQLQRLRQIESAAEADEGRASELLPHHLEALHRRKLTTDRRADKAPVAAGSAPAVIFRARRAPPCAPIGAALAGTRA